LTPKMTIPMCTVQRMCSGTQKVPVQTEGCEAVNDRNRIITLQVTTFVNPLQLFV